MEVLTELRDRRGLSLILVSHDLHLVADRTDSVGVMSEGRIVEAGPTTQLFSSPTHPVTAAPATRVTPGGEKPAFPTRGQ